MCIRDSGICSASCRTLDHPRRLLSIVRDVAGNVIESQYLSTPARGSAVHSVKESSQCVRLPRRTPHFDFAASRFLSYSVKTWPAWDCESVEAIFDESMVRAVVGHLPVLRTATITYGRNLSGCFNFSGRYVS